jgi:hypothetical protein
MSQGVDAERTEAADPQGQRDPAAGAARVAPLARPGTGREIRLYCAALPPEAGDSHGRLAAILEEDGEVLVAFCERMAASRPEGPAYRAILRGIFEGLGLGAERMGILTDSRAAVARFGARWGSLPRHPALRETAQAIWILAEELSGFEIAWLPGPDNPARQLLEAEAARTRVRRLARQILRHRTRQRRATDRARAVAARRRTG